MKVERLTNTPYLRKLPEPAQNPGTADFTSPIEPIKQFKYDVTDGKKIQKVLIEVATDAKLVLGILQTLKLIYQVIWGKSKGA